MQLATTDNPAENVWIYIWSDSETGIEIVYVQFNFTCKAVEGSCCYTYFAGVCISWSSTTEVANANMDG